MSRALFEAPARRDVCVELPEEAMERGETTKETVGKLLASLYGTRDASANWQDEVKSVCAGGVSDSADSTRACSRTAREAYGA